MREEFGAMARPENSFSKILLKTFIYYAAVFFQGASSIVLPAASVILKSPEANGFSDHQYGFLFLPMIAGGLLTTYGMPLFLKRWKIHQIFYFGIISEILFLGMLFLSGFFGGGFYYFLFANGLFGLGSGILLSVVTILVIDLYPDHRDPAVAGLHTAIGIGCALTPVLLHACHVYRHWTLEAGILGAGFLLLFLFSILTRSVTVQDHPAPDPALARPHDRPVFPPWGVLLFLISIIGYGTVESLIGNWSTVYLQIEGGFDFKTAEICLTLFWGFVTVGRLLTALLTLKWDSRIFYRLSPIVTAGAAFWLLHIKAVPSIFGIYILLGLGCSCYFPLAVSLSTEYFDDWRHFLSSFSAASLMVGVALGSSLVGSLRNGGWFSLTQAFHGAWICALLMAAAGFWLTRRPPDVRLKIEKR